MRKWFEKAHGAIIWTIAFAFVAGIVIWSLMSYFSTRRNSEEYKYSLSDSVAYLTKDGTALSSEYWIFPWDIENSYGQALSYYQITEVDPIFEEPLIKASLLSDLINTKVILYYAEINDISPTDEEIKSELDKQLEQINANEKLKNYINQKYGSVQKYLDSIKPDVEKYLTISKVKNLLGVVSDEEIKKYYNENKEDLKAKYDSANVDYVYFSSPASANEFISSAMEKGFYQAATDASLNVQNVAEFKRGILDKNIEETIFESSNTMVGPVPIGNSLFVFNVKDVKTVDTYEKFVLSKGYQEVLSTLKDKKFNSAIQEFKENNNISFEIIDPIYKVWYNVLHNSGKDLIQVYKEIQEQIFDDTSLKVGVPVEIKSAFVTLVEKMKHATEVTQDPNLNKVLKDAEKEANMVVENIYEEYPDSFVAVEKMKNLHPDRIDVSFKYYSRLYSKIKPYLEYGMMQSVMNDFIDLYSGLSTLADATDISLDMKAEVLYDLYEINKILKDATTASEYLERLKEATPDYMDYDSAFSELKFMLTNESTTSNTNQ
ncbi:peptidyl-prolyl cis-trans isomerase [Thermosipho atlanticus]|uniref:PPIC-type PPIASE domain-containing protein n=1 Tax=Thermosipho atlanticus DSM 15807 TaxID=1123380 RepID=A0A1M5QY55_9BACT|nr:peptidyl-prolyl cis-trans isomerase [Thermosipho atlanticus]SHH19074.1 PPIC-type PPIASE domain-containing protein [Thermosipho atlanticus DSM 15807]